MDFTCPSIRSTTKVLDATDAAHDVASYCLRLQLGPVEIANKTRHLPRNSRLRAPALVLLQRAACVPDCVQRRRHAERCTSVAHGEQHVFPPPPLALNLARLEVTWGDGSDSLAARTAMNCGPSSEFLAARTAIICSPSRTWGSDRLLTLHTCVVPIISIAITTARMFYPYRFFVCYYQLFTNTFACLLISNSINFSKNFNSSYYTLCHMRHGAL